MNYESSQLKIRVQVTLTEPLSKLLIACREKGLSDSTVVESALADYFAKNNIGE